MASDDSSGMGQGGSPPSEPDERTPFERFEDVLRKVVSVPKSAVDAERERHRNRKAQIGQLIVAPMSLRFGFPVVRVLFSFEFEDIVILATGQRRQHI